MAKEDDDGSDSPETVEGVHAQRLRGGGRQHEKGA